MDFGAELSKKESIAQGVKNLLAVTTDPATKSLLEAQLSSVKKEIQMMKRSVDNLSTPGQAPTLSMSDLSPKKLLQMMTSTYESNGHTFKVKSVAPSAACYHCHDTLYGNNQTLECKCKCRSGLQQFCSLSSLCHLPLGCHLTCHKYCYTLVKETCEDHLHLHNATKWFFMANDEADRMRWVTGLDHIRANVKEEARTAAARSSTPTSHTSLSRMTSQSDSRKDEHA